MKHQSQIVYGSMASINEYIYERSIAITGKAPLVSNPDYFETLKVSGHSIGIAQIKELKTFTTNKPYFGKGKLIVVKECEKLTSQAQNSLLKILEEPPEDTMIILASTSKPYLIETIYSRCQFIKLDTPPGEGKNQEKHPVEKKNNFIHSNLIDRLIQIKELLEKKPNISEEEICRKFLHDLSLYFRGKIRSRNLHPNEIKQIRKQIKLIDESWKQISATHSVKLTMENLAINL